MVCCRVGCSTRGLILSSHNSKVNILFYGLIQPSSVGSNDIRPSAIIYCHPHVVAQKTCTMAAMERGDVSVFFATVGQSETGERPFCVHVTRPPVLLPLKDMYWAPPLSGGLLLKRRDIAVVLL